MVRGRDGGRMPRSGRRSAWRQLVVLLGVVAMAGVVLFRLVQVQVVHADELKAEAQDRRSVTSVLPGPRGDVVAADGTVLATSVTRWDITADPHNAAEGGDVPRQAARIAAVLGLDAATVERTLTADPSSRYVLLKKRVTLATFDRVRALALGWVVPAPVQMRTYPAGGVAGNLVGFVGGQQQPQAGLEYGQDACLAGTDGSSVTQTGEDGTPLPGSETTMRPARPGGTLRLTIDRDLQYYAQQVLADRARETGAQWGSVVVQEVTTGRLLAVADWPTVDPNDVAATASRDTGALGSRAFTAPFEPGSTMKTVTAAMLMHAGLATPRTEVLAPYRLQTSSGADVNDSHQHDTERLTLTGVIVESSNTGISQLGMQMPDGDRYELLQRFGFGSATEVGFGAEASGDLGAGAPAWDAQSRLATMFGQGLSASAVQMASAYQTLANDGVRLPVRLVESCTDADGTVHGSSAGAGRRVVSADAAVGAVRILENVATKGWLASEVKIPGYRVGIKTGTAQVSDGRGEYAEGYLVSMAGVAPADDPRFVVYVDLHDPTLMNTSQATAPVFRDVMARALQAAGVVPSGSRSPDIPTRW